jgi:hypothetical protein
MWPRSIRRSTVQTAALGVLVVTVVTTLAIIATQAQSQVRNQRWAAMPPAHHDRRPTSGRIDGATLAGRSA